MLVRRMREDMRRRSHRFAILVEGGDEKQPRVLSCKEARQSKAGETLLSQVANQIGRNVPREHVFIISGNSQDCRSRTDLNRYPGTLLSCLRHVVKIDSEAVAVFFPVQRSYQDEERFPQAISEAYRVIQSRLCQDSIIVLGVTPRETEPGLGWIEPKPSILGCSGGSVRRVLRFCCDPPAKMLSDLVPGGCLQSTSVMIGRADAFLELAARTEPENETAAEFSNRILTAATCRLLVLPLEELKSSGTETTILKRAAWF